MGGREKTTSFRSVEVFDSRAPQRGWRMSQRLQMPTGMSEHCSVVVPGPTGKEVVVTGGRGRGNRAMKLSLATNKWYSLHHLGQRRRRHACTKVRINGRQGLVVSGGASPASPNMTSVEFFDISTGQWFELPPLQRGRRSHAMVVEDGRLMVTGGMQVIKMEG